MYKTILVPLDGSKRAEAILPYVQNIAESAHSRVVLLTVLPHEVATSAVCVRARLAAGEEIDDLDPAEIYLSRLVKKMQSMDIQSEYRVACGPVVEMIIKIAAELDASLISIASHGRNGIGRVFYGSVTAGVLQSVDRPLLVIRSRNLH